MQITDDWDDRYRSSVTPWQDEESAPATRELVLQHVPPGQSILEIGCGRGIDSIWLAEQGYRVAACDLSATAVSQAEEKAREHGVAIDFYVADVLRDQGGLPRCQVVFDRGVFHTFTTDEGRALFAQTVANMLGTGGLWLSLAGVAPTAVEAEEAVQRREPRVTASQITRAIEPHFDVVSITRVSYGHASETDFPALACAFQRRS